MGTAAVEQKSQWGAVVAVSLGTVVAALDMTIVAVALPTMGADFAASPSAMQWVQLAFALPLVALSIPGGRWLDRAGPLPAFLVALGGFGVASVLIAVAPSFGVLVAGRVLQGVFGALIGVVGMPIIALSVRPEHRARAMSLLLTLIPLSGVAGPAVGGLLTEAYGWRSVFLVNIPLVAVASWFGVRTIPARVGERAGLPRPDRAALLETVVLGVAGTAFFLGLDLLGRGKSTVLASALLVIAVLAVPIWLRLRHSRPVIGLLRRRVIALGLLAMPMITTSAGGLNFLVPYFLVGTRDISTELVGVALLAMPAAMAVASPVAGVLADRIGTKPFALAGAVVTLAGLLAMVPIGSDAGVLDVAWRMAIIGIGHGLFAGPNAAAILAATPPSQAGTASGMAALVRTMGFAIGPAIGALAFAVTGTATGAVHSGFLVMAALTAIAVAAVLAEPASSAR